MRIITVIAVLLSNVVFAQEKNGCNEAFSHLTNTIENNYPGFTEKTKDKVAYNYFKRGLIEKLKIADKSQCLSILKEYTSYFKDDHIFFLSNSNYLKFDKNKIRKSIKINKHSLDKINTSKDTLEGIWQNESLTIGIIKNKNNYTGFILKSDDKQWKVNNVIFEIFSDRTAKYFNSDSTSFDDEYLLTNKSVLRFKKSRNVFIKGEQNNKLQLTSSVDTALGFYIGNLSNKTALIKLGSFDYPFVSRIKNMIERNKGIIENSENLIIDLRNNGGGTTDAFLPLLPYLMTGNTRSMSAETFVSDFLISGIEKYARNLENSPSNKAEKERLNKLIIHYRNNLNKYVLPQGDTTVTVDSYNLNSKSPKQITFLINKKVGSAAESLLMLARQSKKVKILGTPTHGVLDYANAYITSYEYDGHPLILPTYRSLRIPDYPIDNIGIQPDVYIDKSIQKWEQFAVEYLEN